MMSDDHAWFDGEVACHLTAVYRYFVRRVPLQDADDLTAEVFATAWRRRDDVTRGGELPWLYTTARYVLSNHRRRAAIMPLHAMPALSTPDHADRAARSDELTRVLQHLKPRDRDILLLHAWEGLDGDQLAEVLGITRTGAQAALSRARARFRAVWHAEDVATEHLQDPPAV